MRFVMYVDEMPIDAINISGNQVKVSQLIKTLKEKNKQILREAKAEPVFVLEQVPSVMNDFKLLQVQSERNHAAQGS